METDPEPKAASVARTLRGAQTDGVVARIGGAAEVRGAGRPGRKFEKAALLGWRSDRTA